MKIRLDEWLKVREFDRPPAIRTACLWVNACKIFPAPVKIGRSYYVQDGAVFRDGVQKPRLCSPSIRPWQPGRASGVVRAGNLHEPRPGYYVWRNPITKKTMSIGYVPIEQVFEVLEANAKAKEIVPTKRLVERMKIRKQ
ncbi:excisionase [Paraburkholderia caribensis]|uniref:Excisionase domain protein n=2 Tax=Paraburkholderia TaxID=1822464 RepID=B2JXJ9_PARP8|nr:MULTISPECIES: excisionase [Paraburkholderia]ACC76357.1 Excisionase domain protein [Paraburkholderia phymatum STM815]MCO4882470.1 excisionase domain-containing protein [Paraburkholderia caribensis]